MNFESNLANGKKPYEPPRLTAIGLRPEEAVLGHCKTFNSSGPANSTCFPLCNSSIGS
jgi:hypothetical protein